MLDDKVFSFNLVFFIEEKINFVFSNDMYNDSIKDVVVDFNFSYVYGFVFIKIEFRVKGGDFIIFYFDVEVFLSRE